MNELFRRVPCTEPPKLRVDASGVAFDHSPLPSLYDLNPYINFCRNGSEMHLKMDGFDSGTYDIPCPESATVVSVSANSSAICPKSYSRISVGAVIVFIIELLMLVLFDAQLMAANAVSPGFTYFWIAQLVVASISLLFFTSCICARHSRSRLEAVMATSCLMTNMFILTCAGMVVSQYVFSTFQIYVFRMSILACRIFNCVVCVATFRNQLLKCIGLCSKKDSVQCQADVPSKHYKPLIATLQLAKAENVSPSSLHQNSAQKFSSVLMRVTNRLALLGSGHTLQDYVTCSEELNSICQPQNRLLLSLRDVWKVAIPGVLDVLSDLSLGGHVVVDCDADGRCGLLEIFSVCCLVCEWLRRSRSNTVVIFHQGSQSCASLLCCCILMATGLSPRCEHSLHLVMLSLSLNECRDVGLISTRSRRMLRQFESFLHAEQHPVCAAQRFLSMIVLKGCVRLPPGFIFSIDVICGGAITVKSGRLLSSSAVDINALEIECQSSSAATCTFCFEVGCVLCKGDLEVIILVKNMSNGVSAKVASVMSHSSFCGIMGPHIFRCSAADIDWLGGKEHVPILFTDIELHFRNSAETGLIDQMACAFGRVLLHMNLSKFDLKTFLHKLLIKSSQKQVATGVSLNSGNASNRASSITIVVNGAFAVDLPRADAMKSATCIPQALASGQMLPSLKVKC